ncbi:MAG TPA: hypothetical protein VET23_08535 [Chitinophagaceae bacterium]|nr:hypothetical protein [Chitinophagaceae bacterium]
MKKLSLFFIIVTIAIASSAQDSTGSRQTTKPSRKEERRQRVNTLIRQAEEGTLVYSKQSIFGVQFRTNGYGGFYEFGKMKTNRKTTIFRLDINETKSQKEEKLPTGGFFFGNPFVYGKINHFYPTTIGVGQQYILGQKGNKNGVAVSAVYNAGIALGILRPYYIDVKNPITGNNETIKFTSQDSALFLGPTIYGSGGFGKGWNEIMVKPGAFVKAALRFDYGRFNETVSGIEAGISIEAYSGKIPIMLYQKQKQLFFQGYISLLFGRRK